MAPMSETVTVDGPPVAKEPVTVSASALARHLHCSRAYISKLDADGVIHRRLLARSVSRRLPAILAPRAAAIAAQ
jgi:hypothetical protein